MLEDFRRICRAAGVTKIQEQQRFCALSHIFLLSCPGAKEK